MNTLLVYEKMNKKLGNVIYLRINIEHIFLYFLFKYIRIKKEKEQAV